MLILLQVRLSPLSRCRWTSLSLSALWSIISAAPVGSSSVDFSSGRVIPLFKGRCSAHDSSPQIGVVAAAFVNPNGMTHCTNCPYQGFVLVASLDSDQVHTHSWRLVEHLRDLWERISVLHRGFIESSVVHTQPQSAVLLCSRDYIDPRNLCGSSRPGTLSYPLTLFLRSSSQNCSSSRIPFGCRERCSMRNCHIFAAYVHLVLVSHGDTTSIISRYITWIFQSGDLHSRSQQPLHSSFVERM